MHSLGCRSCARYSGLLVLPRLGTAGFQSPQAGSPASAASVRHSLGKQGLCRIWWAVGWRAVCWGFRDSALPAFAQIHDRVGEIRPKVWCGVRLCSHFCVVTGGKHFVIQVKTHIVHMGFRSTFIIFSRCPPRGGPQSSFGGSQTVCMSCGSPLETCPGDWSGRVREVPWAPNKWHWI